MVDVASEKLRAAADHGLGGFVSAVWVAGYAILQFASKAEALEWTKRFVQVDAPLRLGGEGECEIRQIFTSTDAAPGCVTEQHAHMKEQYAKVSS